MATVGRFNFDVAQLETVASKGASIDELSPGCLGGLTHLLASSGSHHHRLEAGDRLLGYRDAEGRIRGIVWANLFTHTDRFAGRISRPSTTRCYLNQLMVDADARGMGIGEDLVRGVLAVAHDHGRTHVTALISPSNQASQRCFEKAGAEALGSLYGVRMGQRFTVRYFRPCSSPR